MIKKYRMWIILTCIVTLMPILIGLWSWDILPDMVATSFGADGVANGWSSKYFAVFGLPCILLFLHIFCVFFTLLDPRRKNISPKMLRFVFWIVPLVSWVCAVAVYGNALGLELNIMTIVYVLVGVIFIGIGNYLPKCRQNYTVGVKLPWTLADEENWNKTNRLAGWLFVLVGFLSMISAFTGKFMLPLIGAILSELISIVYSLALYLKKKNDGEE